MSKSGEELRDEGIERVQKGTSPLWHARYNRLCAEMLLLLPPGSTFTGEAFRLYATDRGLPPPHHHNVWGADARGYVTACIRLGLIEIVGRDKATDPKAHARSYPTYRKL